MNSSKEQKNNDTSEVAEKPSPQKDQLVETQHVIKLNGIDIPYTVTCGTIVLKEEAEKEGESEGEKPKATFFFVAYIRDDIEEKTKRPLTFSFNGGPGSVIRMAASRDAGTQEGCYGGC